MKDGILPTRRPSVLIGVSLGLLAASSARAQSSADPASLRWGVPTTLPTNARVAIASGDPAGPGETTFVLSMPNGYRIAPHFHPTDTHLAVTEGTLLVGIGDRLDRTQAKALAAGDSATVPAGMHHFLITRGRTIATMRFTGPFTITYLRAEDAPRPRAFPTGY